MNKIKEWLIELVCKAVQAGGHCGLCGTWIDYELFPVAWPYGICEKCRLLTLLKPDQGFAPESSGHEQSD